MEHIFQKDQVNGQKWKSRFELNRNCVTYTRIYDILLYGYTSEEEKNNIRWSMLFLVLKTWTKCFAVQYCKVKENGWEKCNINNLSQFLSKFEINWWKWIITFGGWLSLLDFFNMFMLFISVITPDWIFSESFVSNDLNADSSNEQSACIIYVTVQN